MRKWLRTATWVLFLRWQGSESWVATRTGCLQPQLLVTEKRCMTLKEWLCVETPVLLLRLMP